MSFSRPQGVKEKSCLPSATDAGEKWTPSGQKEEKKRKRRALRRLDGSGGKKRGADYLFHAK